MLANSFNVQQALEQLPHKPGVYQFYDNSGKIIYIGKAKNLKKRVSSYFKKEQHSLNTKTQVLVSKIRNLTFTIVDTEIDAWLLENNLIKKHQPRYNVLLKDDKTFPWIVIKNEPFPRIFWTRRMVKDQSKYFGPYASLTMMHTILHLIKELFPLRTCNLALSDTNIQAQKFKACLEYQIGNCLAPCENKQSLEEYNTTIDKIKDILNGKINPVIRLLKTDIQDAASKLEFEKAHILKEKLELLETYQSKSTVVNTAITNVDVLNIASDEQFAFVNYLRVIDGMVVQTQTIALRKRLDESDEELLSMAFFDFRSRFESNAKEIIVPFELPSIEGFKFLVPQQGDKKQLLELSRKNVLFFKKERLDQYEKLNPDLKTERILLQMQKDLRLTEPPVHIECFDNSNFHGTAPVSSIVVFKNAKPSKKDYRWFHVKTVVGPNDFATMEEAVYRRYKRMLEEQQPLPNLIIIDGGKGQISSAMSSLKKLNLDKKIPLIGIAKKLEEIFYPNDPYPLHLDKRSETLKIIQQLRDEAHRFGITAHRKNRDKKTLHTELADIKGIGSTSAERLLQHFKSVGKIKKASLEELANVVTKNQAKAIVEYFRPTMKIDAV